MSSKTINDLKIKDNKLIIDMKYFIISSDRLIIENQQKI